MRIVFLTALALIAWMFVRYERGSAALENLRARLNAHPGFVLTGIDRRGGALTAHGLLDPDAEPLKESLGDAAPPLQFDTVGYVSTDDAIIARRARRLLDLAAQRDDAVAGGALALGGRADPGWIEVARERAAWVPGVRRVDFAVVADTDEGAQARALLDQIVRALAERRVAFLRGTEPVPDGGTVVDAIAADARRASAIAAMAHVSIAWTASGTNDDPGSDRSTRICAPTRALARGCARIARHLGRADGRSGDERSTQVRQRGAFLRARRRRNAAIERRQARKLCMLGDFGVGKTSLVSRFVHSTFSDKYLTTIGVKVDTKEIALTVAACASWYLGYRRAQSSRCVEHDLLARGVCTVVGRGRRARA